MPQEEVKTTEFQAIKLKLASPEQIKAWSYGEVTKPETINYRTQKPEKDGLFAEEIFGPSKDWECYCGKYKRIRYKGIICEKCGVEVTKSLVRRERMGHISLAAPVSHIWFLRGVPSKIGMVLDLSIQDLEKVIYFANFIITKVDSSLKEETLKQIDQEYQTKKKAIEADFNKQANELKQQKVLAAASPKTPGAKEKSAKLKDEELINLNNRREAAVKNLEEAVELAQKELKSLHPGQIISEHTYQDLSLKYGHVFEASIGAEAVRQLLTGIDLDATIKKLEVEKEEAPVNRQRRVVRRLKLLRNLKNNKIRPEWTILTVIPVIPPDLRPMVQLDGGRFAASDLNDLYRRVINRNNRLKRLIELNAPEVICRNEKRMLQEAVDALIDNSARHGKTVTASTGQKRMLKSIADMLKGKQGRFRQNLLGKRVDYSGRSVIVIGPNLKLHQCGIPKTMALELFRPFVISQLIKKEYVHNVRSAGRFIESGRAEVWDILEKIANESHLLLNRAPTLHRLGIQAFQPILIEGKAIQIHPLVCPPFNADFDGDQMAVHLPLTENAKKEAAGLMLSTRNLLKPATGNPVVTPEQDIILGCFYLTLMKEEGQPIKTFSNSEEAIIAYQNKIINTHDKIKVRINNKMTETSLGRIMFNSILPKELPFINEALDKKTIRNLISQFLEKYGQEVAVQLLDKIKNLGFAYLTQSGLSWGMNDLHIPQEKSKIIKEAEGKIDEIQGHYETGLLTSQERHNKVIEVWDEAKSQIMLVSKKTLDKFGPVYSMIESGARGAWSQIVQMMGMKGLVTNPAGEIIELPVKGSFKEGFDVLEYFISTHGARKGLSDTALRTANAGYLTRRLIDVCQDVVIMEEDCGDEQGTTITSKEAGELGEDFIDQVLGRVSLTKIVNPKTKQVILKKNELITKEIAAKLKRLKLDQLKIRSILSCQSLRGVCQKCYGWDLGYNQLVALGTAVGIIAAQSIGEPGTQLTMRTFHTGGVAELDITQGLPRVEEIFEVRPIKKAGVLTEFDGQIKIREEGRQKFIQIHQTTSLTEKFILKEKIQEVKGALRVKDDQKVKPGFIVYESAKERLMANLEGAVKIKTGAKADEIEIISAPGQIREYPVPLGLSLLVKNGQSVKRGDQLTEGALDLKQLYYLKGKEATQKYIIKEIQYIYSSQGQKLNAKHIETVVRQIFSKVYIKDGGETDFLSGEITDFYQIIEANKEVQREKGKEAEFDRLLLGITKASLTTDSFLSAASFQETARVLIDAAVTGKIDYLRGLKENVIIGKLIPAGTGFDKEEK